MRAASSGVPHRALDPGPRPCPAAPDGRDTPPARPMGGPAIRRSGGSVHPTPAGLNLRCHSVPSIRPPRPLYPPSLDPCSPRKVMAARERLCGHEKPPPQIFWGVLLVWIVTKICQTLLCPPPSLTGGLTSACSAGGLGLSPQPPNVWSPPVGPATPPTGRWAGSAHSNTLASVGVVRCLVCVPGPPAEQTQPPLGALPSELADPPRPTVSCPTNFRTTPMTRNVRPSRLPDHPESPDVRPTAFPGLPQPGLVCRPGGGSHAVVLHTDRCAALPPPVSPQVSG